MNAHPINEGDRPSRLQLARLATGELEGEERDRIARWAQDHPEGRAFLHALEAARDQVPPLDVRALRARAADPVVPTPANRPFRLALLAPVIALAAALLLVLVPSSDPVPENPTGIRVKGDAGLTLHHLDGGTLRPWDGRPLGEGDVVGVTVRPGAHRAVTVLSVDGSGALSVWWPEQGEHPEPLPGTASEVPLSGSLTLDDAPGPEVFVAVFDRPVAEARDEVATRHAEGGAAAVLRWAEEAPGVEALRVEKR